MPASSSQPLQIPGDLYVRLEARLLDVLVLLAIDSALGQTIGYGFTWLFAATAVVLAYFSLLDTVVGAVPFVGSVLALVRLKRNTQNGGVQRTARTSVHLRALKNSCISARHASSHTPATTST